MWQKQYYSTKLKNTHIQHIWSNYNIKYSTLKSEIDTKVNNLIQLFWKDISAFWENIETISREKNIIRDYENTKKEVLSLSKQWDEKENNEKKWRIEIFNWNKKISDLEETINARKSPKKSKKDIYETNNHNQMNSLALFNTSSNINNKQRANAAIGSSFSEMGIYLDTSNNGNKKKDRLFSSAKYRSPKIEKRKVQDFKQGEINDIQISNSIDKAGKKGFSASDITLNKVDYPNNGICIVGEKNKKIDKIKSVDVIQFLNSNNRKITNDNSRCRLNKNRKSLGHKSKICKCNIILELNDIIDQEIKEYEKDESIINDMIRSLNS